MWANIASDSRNFEFCIFCPQNNFKLGFIKTGIPKFMTQMTEI